VGLHVSIGTPLRRSRKSASREEVAMKPRLFLLVVNLALLAAWLGRCGWHPGHSWPDGS
jgi:hypothetical protein